MAALLAGACAVWFALFEVYYDGSPMPAFLASGERIVFFLPMLTVYLARELLRGRRWAFAGAWLASFAAFGLATAIDILRNPLLRLGARLVLTSTVSLLLMRLLYALGCSLRTH